jgi:hypothetical protein
VPGSRSGPRSSHRASHRTPRYNERDDDLPGLPEIRRNSRQAGERSAMKHGQKTGERWGICCEFGVCEDHVAPRTFPVGFAAGWPLPGARRRVKAFLVSTAASCAGDSSTSPGVLISDILRPDPARRSRCCVTAFRAPAGITQQRDLHRTPPGRRVSHVSARRSGPAEACRRGRGRNGPAPAPLPGSRPARTRLA